MSVDMPAAHQAVTFFDRPLKRFAALLMPLLLAACVGARPQPFEVAHTPGFSVSAEYLAMYGERPDEQYPLPATDLSEVDPQFLRREVAYPTREQPGTIIVDTDNKFLYLVRENGRAIRYGIGVPLVTPHETFKAHRVAVG